MCLVQLTTSYFYKRESLSFEHSQWSFSIQASFLLITKFPEAPSQEYLIYVYSSISLCNHKHEFININETSSYDLTAFQTIKDLWKDRTDFKCKKITD